MSVHRKRGMPAFAMLAIGLFAGAALGGDIDNDGVDDSIDACCNTPDGITVDAVGRPLGDVDGDCDVDLADFQVVQGTFTGPGAGGCWTDADCDDADPCTVDQCNVGNGNCTSSEVPNCNTCTVPAECSAITCDNPVEGEVNPFIETDTFCFCVTEGENVRIVVAELAGSGANFAPNWRLLEAEGAAFGACGVFAATEGRDCGPLPAAGNPYRVEVEDQGRNDIGFYSVHLHRYGQSSPCGQATIDSCEAITSGTIEDVNDADLINLNVENGERVRISILEESASGANFAPNWRLLDGLGVPTSDCGNFVASVSRDCGPLNSALNRYRIEVEDAGRDDIGGYTAHVQRLTSLAPCGVEGVACGVTRTDTIATALDTDLFNFAAGNGEMVRVTVARGTPVGPNFAPSWRVIDASGIATASCGSFVTTVGKDCGPFTTVGSPYRIEVEDQGRNDTGTYRIRLQHMTQFHECAIADVDCDAPVIVRIDEPIDAELARFTAPGGELVRVSVLEQPGGGATFAPNWRLLNAAGVATSNCSSFSALTSRDCGPLPASGNPYRVQVEDQNRDDIGSAQVLVEFLNSGCPQ